MSSRNTIEDSRYTIGLPQGGSTTVGRYFYLNSSGNNHVAGEPPGTPHNYDITLIDRGTGLLQFKVKKPGDWYCGYNTSEVWTTCNAVAGYSRSWDSNDDIHLYNKLGDVFDDGVFNTPVFVGELGESVDMLADNFRRLAQAGLAVKRGNLIGAAKILGHEPRRSTRRMQTERQSISDGWLELQYGWRPLLSDIYSLSDAIQKRDQPRRKTIYVSHSIPADQFVASYSGYTATGSGSYGKRIVAHIDEVVPTLADKMGLHDPLSITWELLPFSFVADWALPVGDYLRARNVASRIKGTFVITTKDKRSARFGSLSRSADDGCLIWPSGPSLLAWEKRVTLSRRVYTSLPQIKLPTFRSPFSNSEKRVFDALALVASIFGHKIGT